MAGAAPATVAVVTAAVMVADLVAAAVVGVDSPPVAPAVAAPEQPQDSAARGGDRSTREICLNINSNSV